MHALQDTSERGDEELQSFASETALAIKLQQLVEDDLKIPNESETTLS